MAATHRSESNEVTEVPTVEDALELEATGNRSRSLELLGSLADGEPTNANVAFHYGRLLFKDARPEDAREHLLAASRLRPGHPATWRELAAVQMRLGDQAGADTALQRLHDMRPSDGWALRNLGAVRLKLGRHALAIEALDSYLLENLEDRAAHIDLCWAHHGLGRSDRAKVELAVLQRDAELEPDGLALLGEIQLADGAREIAIENLQAAVSGGVARPNTKLILANALLAELDPEAALAALEGLPGTGPEALLGARALFRLGDIERALTRVAVVLDVDGSDREALALKADLLEADGDKEGALACCLKLQKLGAEIPRLPVRIARLRIDVGETTAALETLNRYLTRHSSDVNALVMAGDLELRNDSDKSAFRRFSAAIQHDPDCGRAQLQLSRIWLSHDRPRRALLAGRRAAELDPANPESAMAVAEAHVALDQGQDAIPYYQLALELGEESKLPHRRLAVLFGAQSHHEQALHHGLIAAEGHDRDPKLCLVLAQALIARGEEERGRSWIENGLRHVSGDPSLLEALSECDLREDRLDDAIEHSRVSMQASGVRPGARRVLGLALTRSGQTLAALPLLAQSLSHKPGDDEVRLELARAHGQHGSHNEVLALYPDATTLPASQETLGLMLGESAHMAGDLKLARAILDNLFTQDCQSRRLLETFAQVLVAGGESSRALSIVEFACRVHPECWEFVETLAELHSAAGRYFEARQELARARRMVPSEKRLYLASGCLEIADRRPADAAPHLDTYIQMAPKDPAGHHHRGQAYLLAGHRYRAEECFRRALRFDPEHTDSYVSLGRLLLRSGRTNEARRLLEGYVTRTSRRQEVLGELASVFLTEDRPLEAESYLRELVETGPEGSGGIRPLAELLLGQKRDREALAVLDKAGDDSSKMLIDLADWLCSHGEHRRARVLYERTLTGVADSEQAMMGIARCHVASGERSTAKKWLEQVVSRSPRHKAASLELARLLSEEAARNDSSQAKSQMEFALELLERFWTDCWTDVSALKLYAAMASRLGKIEEAVRAARRALELDDKQPDAHIILADIHFDSGENAEALEEYLKALALDPGREEAARRATAFLEASGQLLVARTVMEKVVQMRPSSRNARLGLARLCHKLGDPKGAVLHWEAASRSGSLGADDLTDLAGTYMRMKRYSDAERVNSERLRKEPKGLEPLLLAGDVAFAAGRLSEARVRYNQVARIHPDDSRSASRLAELFRREGRHQDALFQVRHALKQAPTDVNHLVLKGRILIEMNRHDVAREPLEKALEQPGGHLAEAGLLLARVHRLLDNRHRAAETLKGLIDSGVAGVEARREMADLQFDRGDWRQSADIYESLREKGAPLDRIGLQRLALCYGNMGMSARGADLLRQLPAGQAPDVDVVLDMARACLRQGCRREGLALMREELARHDKPGRARLQLEIGRIHHEAGNPAEATQSYAEALSLSPTDVNVQERAASFLMSTGQVQNMRHTFAELTREYPAEPRAHCHLGIACLKLGLGREAERAFRRAIELDYNLKDAHSGLARACRQLGDLTTAIEEYRKARFLDPKNSRLHFELATAFAEQGQTDSAVSQFEKLLRQESSGSSLAAAARAHLQSLKRLTG